MEQNSIWLEIWQLQLIKDLLTLDIRTTMSIAEQAGINRSSLADALSRKRSLPHKSLMILMRELKISPEWTLITEDTLWWKCGADISPLERTLKLLEQYNNYLPKNINIELSWIPQTELARPKDFNKPFRGIFILELKNQHDDGMDFIVLFRDPYFTGGGKKVTVTQEDAKPISPTSLPLRWKFKEAESSIIEVNINNRRRMENVFAKKESVFGFAELSSIITNDKIPMTWVRLKQIAEAKGYTPQDIADLISNASNK